MTGSDKPLGGANIEAALAEAQDLLEKDPRSALRRAAEVLNQSDDARAFRLAAEAHRRLGDPARAEAAELLAIQAGMQDFAMQRADAALQQGRIAEAATIVANHLESYPDDLLALTILGEALAANHRLEHAEEVSRYVLERARGFSRARSLLSESLMLQSRPREAIDMMEQYLGDRPDNPSLWRDLAGLLTDAGQHDRAAAVYKRLMESEEDPTGALVNYALALRFLDRTDEAAQALRRAISRNPDHGPAWWSLVSMDPDSITADEGKALEAALTRPPRDVENASQLHLARAILLDRSGEHDQAFREFSAGKKLRSQGAPYDPSSLTAKVDAALEFFSPDFYDTRAGWGASDSSPIFIIGMPRSGSTLIERVLGRHSQIEATGELQIIPRLIEDLNARAGQVGGYLDLIQTSNREEIQSLGEAYIQASRDYRRTDKPYFTDKLHMNWRHLGLIHLILPNARVIDVRRNAVDCCWSNFRTLFVKGHPASDDLEHIAQFYRDYRRYADEWARLHPDNILVVQYEDAIADLETQTIRMMDFLRLDFEPACLDFHLSGEPVATASVEQVRRPLNREGVGRWQAYAEWLEPLLAGLGPFVEETQRIPKRR